MSGLAVLLEELEGVLGKCAGPIEVYLGILAAGAGEDARAQCRSSISTMQTELWEKARFTQFAFHSEFAEMMVTLLTNHGLKKELAAFVGREDYATQALTQVELDHARRTLLRHLAAVVDVRMSASSAELADMVDLAEGISKWTSDDTARAAKEVNKRVRSLEILGDGLGAKLVIAALKVCTQLSRTRRCHCSIALCATRACFLALPPPRPRGRCSEKVRRLQ